MTRGPKCPPRPTIWFETEDFFEHFDRAPKATGIQRVQMEVFAEAKQYRWARGEIRFCRLNRLTQRFRPVDFDALERVFHHPPLTSAPPPFAPNRHPLTAWILNERYKFRNTRHRFYSRIGDWVERMRRRGEGARDNPFAPGDILVCLGIAWENPQYGELIARARRDWGMRFAILIYDLIPVTHPHWVTPHGSKVFRRWVDSMIENADLLLTISSYVRSTVLAYAAKQRLTLASAKVLPLGSGFRILDATVRDSAIARLPARYVLFVSTLAIRKNHQLLMRVWRRLVEKHGADRVPPLVFVGQRGWMLDDFMNELIASRYLDGKIIVLSDLSDAEINEVYRRCLFSVYPSLVEGWGLPIAESLEHGKPCVASNRTSMPEVGGDLVDYIDPEDDAAVTATIERVIFDDAYRNGRAARIRAEYRPRSWAECIEALIADLDALCDADQKNLGVTQVAGYRS